MKVSLWCSLLAILKLSGQGLNNVENICLVQFYLVITIRLLEFLSIFFLFKNMGGGAYSLVTIIVILIVTAQSRQTPLTNPKGEKDLCTRVHPNLMPTHRY